MKVLTAFRLEREQRDFVQDLADALDVSMSEVVRWAIDELFVQVTKEYGTNDK